MSSLSLSPVLLWMNFFSLIISHLRKSFRIYAMDVWRSQGLVRTSQSDWGTMADLNEEIQQAMMMDYSERQQF